ncbi:MAG: 50S ribosomal protein L11 methyltransferase [Oscillospiraceae bacterium]
MDWIDIKVKVPLADAELCEAISTELAEDGIYIEDYSSLEKEVEEIAHVDLIEKDLLNKCRDEVIVHLYANSADKCVTLVNALQSKLLAANIQYHIDNVDIKEEDFANGWRKYYHARDIGNRLAIVPSWEEYNTSRIIIRLDPGLAFGTGTHETTSLCLSVLDERVHGGERVLDIGTGSGILAIAALKLGAAQADGVDIDPVCVRTAGENALLNNVNDHFKVLIGDLSDKATGKYDIICANIVANAIIGLSPSIKPLLADNGIFIASGIIKDRAAQVQSAIIASGLTIEKILTDKDWVLIISHKA